jgi:hypothetical protein
MEAARTSETSIDNHFSRQYIPEDKSEHNLRCFTKIGKKHKPVGESCNMYGWAENGVSNLLGGKRES